MLIVFFFVPVCLVSLSMFRRIFLFTPWVGRCYIGLKFPGLRSRKYLSVDLSVGERDEVVLLFFNLYLTCVSSQFVFV